MTGLQIFKNYYYRKALLICLMLGLMILIIGVSPACTKSSNLSLGSNAGSIDIPISVHGATDLGSLQMDLSYQPVSLEIQGVKASSLGNNAMIDYNQISAGQVRIGLVAASGISGDGEIITISFNNSNKSGLISLDIGKVEATNTNLRDLVVSTSPLQIGKNGTLSSGPILNFAK
jgi:hypothetical protein